MEDAPTLLKIPKVRMSRYLGTSTKAQMAQIMVRSGRSSRSCRKEFVLSPSGRTILGKAIWESSNGTLLGKILNWECLFVKRAKGLFPSVYVDEIKMAGKTENLGPTREIFGERRWFGRTNIVLGPRTFGMYSKRMYNKYWHWQNTGICSSPGFLLGPKKNCPQRLQGDLMQKSYPHGPTTWKVMQRNVWKDIANWQTKQLNSNTKSQHYAWMTINLKKKKMDQ